MADWQTKLDCAVSQGTQGLQTFVRDIEHHMEKLDTYQLTIMADNPYCTWDTLAFGYPDDQWKENNCASAQRRKSDLDHLKRRAERKLDETVPISGSFL
ncbi:hypothetical protein HDE_04472 [Halotydeus destructor]|nr:hypothetical protein HDE_04472 [Halotydeus destructor]